jgi:hypothetical protein
MFTANQLKQLADKGISSKQVMKQLEIFRNGIAPVNLVKPAIPVDGIEIYEKQKIDYYVNLFNKEKYKFSFVKFVPASGAASRMFKTLFETLSELGAYSDNASFIIQKNSQISKFFKNLGSYPFYEDLLKACILKGTDPDELIKLGKFEEILNLLLSAKGLSYGELPKGLLKFHKYPDESRTAFEEHFLEAEMYLRDINNEVKIHFTVSPEHQKLFEKLSEVLVEKYLKILNVRFNIQFSIQKPSTDTLAVDMENRPFLTENKFLLFRPGGHGALLNNMQDLNVNIVFVGNIDNVAPDHTKALRVRYKELLAGILIERIQLIHNFLNRCEAGFSEKLKTEIVDFIRSFVSESSSFELMKLIDYEFINLAKSILNRPVRVCGMVKNIGEPGGGPFWISDKAGHVSKQIVESSQVNMDDPKQEIIFNQATHFNPVDMVCYLSDYKGNCFNLEQFRDNDMAFIAVKSLGENSLKALELPGLWNGSMAGWLTFFIDVPIQTFSPVKTVFDFQREEHIA